MICLLCLQLFILLKSYSGRAFCPSGNPEGLPAAVTQRDEDSIRIRAVHGRNRGFTFEGLDDRCETGFRAILLYGIGGPI